MFVKNDIPTGAFKNFFGIKFKCCITKAFEDPCKHCFFMDSKYGCCSVYACKASERIDKTNVFFNEDSTAKCENCARLFSCTFAEKIHKENKNKKDKYLEQIKTWCDGSNFKITQSDPYSIEIYSVSENVIMRVYKINKRIMSVIIEYDLVAYGRKYLPKFIGNLLYQYIKL